jgi:hypothetical protein
MECTIGRYQVLKAIELGTPHLRSQSRNRKLGKETLPRLRCRLMLFACCEWVLDQEWDLLNVVGSKNYDQYYTGHANPVLSVMT